MSEDNLKVIIELHGNIAAANVYIYYGRAFGMTDILAHVYENKIHVRVHVMGLVHRITFTLSEALFIPSSFYAQQGELCKLKKFDDNVQVSYKFIHHCASFRLQLNPSKISLEEHMKALCLDESFNHQLQTERSYTIVCSSCTNPLANGPIKFLKISNLPFDLTELYENLFCHKESPNKVLEIVSQPANEMFLTSTCYVLSCINKELLYKDFMLDVLKCKSCSSIICNTKRKNLDRLKNSIFCFKDKIQFIDIEDRNKTNSDSQEATTVALNSLLSIIQDTLETSVMCKLYLEAKVPVSEDNCLLLWVVDPKMKRFVSEDGLPTLSPTVEEKNIEFKSVMKILYYLTNSASDIARSWVHDFSVDFHYISDTMLQNINNYFKQSSCHMPRISGYPPNFAVGYLPLK